MIGNPTAVAPREAVLVELDRVARTFGTGANAVVAVHGSSVTVRRSDRIAVCGPSGSGKSTLLHLMAGLDTPTAGTIGWPAWPPGEVGRPGTVGLVFQGASLLTDLDARENVALPLLLADVAEPAARQRAAAALAVLGLDGLRHKLPAEVSAGQAQRIAVARTLASGPQLILADEPTGQLDGSTAQQVVEVLLHTADTLVAGLVVATHDPAVAARMTIQWQMIDGRLRTGAASPLTAGGAR